MKRAILFTLCCHMLHASAVVPLDNEYQKSDYDSVQLIYNEQNVAEAKIALQSELAIRSIYEQMFGSRLDEKLYIAIASSKNQIANAYSTQIPSNLQVNYGAGASMVDYFSTTSWLKTLIYHESAHNYQMNIKASAVSRVLHSVIGNGNLLTILPMSLPNIMINPFMLEGHALFSESYHGNGGRLYSGRHLALVNLQAKANKITPQMVYNPVLEFPYGERYYIVGGFYNLYMAQQYTTKKISHYFKNFSKHWYWPFITNGSMRASVGVDFEDSLSDFAKLYAKRADNMVLAEGKIVARSEFFSQLNSDRDEIYFIINDDGRSFPQLVTMDKRDLKVKKSSQSYLSGKVFKVDDDYYTQSNNFTSILQISAGLYDEDAILLNGSNSRAMQGYLSDGRAVYFDIPSSFSEPQLYIDKQFYSKVNSSVQIDLDDNLYYFIQDGKKRTLYKNREPLMSMRGFYSFVVDILDDGSIYFISTSQFGSTLYRYIDGKTSRVSSADNIIDARLLRDDRVLYACMDSDGYYYTVDTLKNIDEPIWEIEHFFEHEPYYAKAAASQGDIELNDPSPYYSLFDLKYNSTSIFLFSSDGNIGGSIGVNFEDILAKNSLSILLDRDELNITTAMLSYTNSQYLLNYSINLYSTLDKADEKDRRDYGIIASAALAFLRTGHYYGSLKANYYQDYSTASREPVSLGIDIGRYEQYGISMYPNYQNSLQAYVLKERSSDIYTANYSLKHSLGHELYIGANIKHSILQDISTDLDSGIKLSSVSTPEDPSAIQIPTIADNSYVKRATYGEIALAKVLNLSAFFFTFPLSLQRESIYAKYRYYSIEDLAEQTTEFSESTLGVTISTVIASKFTLPFSFEYTYNSDDNTKFNQHKFNLLVGKKF